MIFFATDPRDVSILLPKDKKKIREVTLITCTNGNKQRLILKSKRNIVIIFRGVKWQIEKMP